MRGLIYVAHGSQKTDKNQKMKEFYERLKAGRSEEQQALAFLENHPDSLAVVAEKMVQAGVRQLVIVPLLLFSAMHKEEDIPQQLGVVLQQYPHLRWRICPTFAQEPEVTEVLLAAIRQKQAADELVAPLVLLVAHGSSSYQGPLELVRQIGANLAQASGLKVATAGLYGQPYEATAQGLLEQQQTILVVPFFLFDGHLVTKLQSQLRDLAGSAAGRLHYSETLNLSPKLIPGILRLIERSIADD